MKYISELVCLKKSANPVEGQKMWPIDRKYERLDLGKTCYVCMVFPKKLQLENSLDTKKKNSSFARMQASTTGKDTMQNYILGVKRGMTMNYLVILMRKGERSR